MSDLKQVFFGFVGGLLAMSREGLSGLFFFDPQRRSWLVARGMSVNVAIKRSPAEE
ncbi:MAG: hypothetical protein RI953_2192 [Pseudomonadota bacterium]|jgi:hypothetical protein